MADHRISALLVGLSLAALPTLSHTATTPVPVRKPGWWEMDLNIQGPTPSPIRQKMRICTDAEIDRVQTPFGIHTGASCPPVAISKTADGWAFQENCALKGMTLSTSGRASGDFDSHYHVDLVTHITPAPAPQAAETRIAIDATRLGQCPDSKKPGDVEMSMQTSIAPQP